MSCQSCSGRLFHSTGPAVAKQRSPNWLCDLLTTHVRLSAQHKKRGPAALTTHQLGKQEKYCHCTGQRMVDESLTDLTGRSHWKLDNIHILMSCKRQNHFKKSTITVYINIFLTAINRHPLPPLIHPLKNLFL